MWFLLTKHGYGHSYLYLQNSTQIHNTKTHRFSACWSCLYLPRDWVPSLPLLALGYVYVSQGSTVRFVGSWISFLDCLFFHGWLFGQMESINMACVLQNARDANSKACTRSQVQVDYFTIPYTSTFIRLSYLYHKAISIRLLLQLMGNGLGGGGCLC